MTDPSYVLCTWKKRLWPAKVLCPSGAAGKTPVTRAKETTLEVEILGLKEQLQVNCADTQPLKREHIENIACGLDQRADSSRAVEELKYRCSLKIALDVLSQNGSARQVVPSEEANTLLCQEDTVGTPSFKPLRRYQAIFREKLESGISKKKRKQEGDNPSDTKNQPQEGPLVLEGDGPDISRRGTRNWGDTTNSDSPAGKTGDSKSLPRQEKTKSRLLTKSTLGNKASLKPKEVKKKQGRRRSRGAGSPGACGSNCPQDQLQPLSEEESPLPVPGTSDVAPLRRANTRAQARRTSLDSSCPAASEDLGKSISTESKRLAKPLNGRKKLESVKQLNGGGESRGTVSPNRKRKCRSCPEASSGPSEQGTLPKSLPSPQNEEEKSSTSPLPTSKIGQFQLPDFEEDEGLELSDLSSNIVSTESVSHLSALLEEEEEDEELPRILSPQEPQVMEEGLLVWCKLRRYPYWPAVVKNVKRKHRKACVLLIDGTTNEKKKGFSVPLKNLKHFDCEEKQDLIERAKEGYRQEIEWCVRLISDYRIRVGCHSFTGSFLEYFAADISYPVRKEGYQGSVQMTFPDEAEENIEESPSETSPPKPQKKLLPDRSRAARDRANKKIVEFIVKTKGAEEHLLAILKSRKQSRWLKEFLNSSQYMTCVETYLEDEEQLDLVVNYLKEVYRGIDAKNLHQLGGDGIKLISDVLLPEAIIYAIAAVDDIDYKKAEEKYIKGPSVSKRERELFEEEILERKQQNRVGPTGSV